MQPRLVFLHESSILLRLEILPSLGFVSVSAAWIVLAVAWLVAGIVLGRFVVTVAHDLVRFVHAVVHFDSIDDCHKRANKALDRKRRATPVLFSGVTDRRIGQLSR